MPQADDSPRSEQILTGQQAAKRLGLPLSTVRRFMRDGTLWVTPMANGGVGLSEPEIQRFIERFGRTAANSA